MHCVNCSIFFSAFQKAAWIKAKDQVRLLEWKGRVDLCMYASRRSPKPLLDEVTNYKPKNGKENSWNDVYQRVRELEDDGHGSKLIRALSNGEQSCKPYEGDPRFPIQGGMWQQLGNMGKCNLDTEDTLAAE